MNYPKEYFCWRREVKNYRETRTTLAAWATFAHARRHFLQSRLPDFDSTSRPCLTECSMYRGTAVRRGAGTEKETTCSESIRRLTFIPFFTIELTAAPSTSLSLSLCRPHYDAASLPDDNSGRTRHHGKYRPNK